MVLIGQMNPNDLLDERIINDVSKRRAVVLLPLKDALIYERLNPKFEIAEIKYSPQYSYMYITKNHPKNGRIYLA